MKTPSRILLTGAGGVVGSALRPLLAGRYQEVLLTDLAEVGGLARNEAFERGDISDLGFVRRMVAGVDGIVHLAGMVGAEYSFDEVLGTNIAGTHNVFAAAVSEGVGRVVYASSHHAVGFIRCGEDIDETTAPRPDSEYALSKAFGESAASYFAGNFGINILSIRIGYVGADVSSERRLHTWISPRDLAQIVEIGLTTPHLGSEIVYGISDNPEPYFDNSNAFRLGYRPQERSVDFVNSPEILTQKPDPDSISGGVVGGGFASAGFSGDESRVLGKSNRNSDTP